MHDGRSAGRVAREFDRRLDRFRAGVGEERLVEPWRSLEQSLRQHAGEHGNVELHEIGQIAGDHIDQRVADRRMVAAEREHAPTAEQIEIAVARAVIKIRPNAARKTNVVADRLQNAHPHFVEIFGVKRETLVLARRRERDQIGRGAVGTRILCLRPRKS